MKQKKNSLINTFDSGFIILRTHCYHFKKIKKQIKHAYLFLRFVNYRAKTAIVLHFLIECGCTSSHKLVLHWKIVSNCIYCLLVKPDSINIILVIYIFNFSRISPNFLGEKCTIPLSLLSLFGETCNSFDDLI